jgi:hypothetical protein
MIAALYVREDGPYARLPVDLWGVVRDARTFDGPGPVIAHPPCGAWGRYFRWYKGNDKDCGPIAVCQVRKFGGVLEHPAESKLFKECGMPKPGAPADAWGGVTIEVNQCDWGHRAQKRTWLYMVGCVPPPRPPAGTPTREIEMMGKRERELTPPKLAEWLITCVGG